MEEKIDYQKQFNCIVLAIKDYEQKQQLSNEKTNKPSLLLHACCAPCSSYVIEYLSSIFDITIYYYNPNIHPEEEYNRRLQELQNFLTKFPPAIQDKVKLITASYNPEDYFVATNTKNEIALQSEKERGERCRRCYYLRMKKAYEFAKANSFNFFTTTLSISPYKDSKMINEIGYSLEENLMPLTTMNLKLENTSLEKNSSAKENGITKKILHPKTISITYTPNTGLHYLPADFKKNNGFLRSLQLSSEYDLYRQDYCGCIYSKQNMHHS